MEYFFEIYYVALIINLKDIGRVGWEEIQQAFQIVQESNEGFLGKSVVSVFSLSHPLVLLSFFNISFKFFYSTYQNRYVSNSIFPLFLGLHDTKVCQVL